MNWRGSQGAEARLSAREAVKIRAALAESVNTSTMYEAYLSTSPHSTGNLAQDRARARAWAIINVRVNLEAVKLVLLRIWATGYLIGELSADEIYAQARQAQKSAMITKKETPPARAIGMEIDWDSWTPGDQVTAAILKPPKALRRLLDASGVTIKGINNTTLNDIGNALGESVALGLAPKQAAKLIRQSIASPARALTISITEMRRAVSTTTIERYKSFGLTQMRWVTFTPCDKCEMNDQVVANIGAPFPSGDTQTPAHPNCQCRLAPVIPGDISEPVMSDGTVMPSTAGSVSEVAAPRGVQRMPFEYKPVRPGEGTNATGANTLYGMTVKPGENRKLFEQIAPPAFKQAAEESLKIQASPAGLVGIANDGRMKNVHEVVSSRAEGGSDAWASAYREMRANYETNHMGVPPSLPAAEKPMYGWFYSSGTVHDADYGSVTITLKDDVKSRTTMTAGDSLGESAPVLVKNVLDGTASTEELAAASADGYLARVNLIVSERMMGNTNLPLPTIDYLPYWEAQVHGGVTLQDMKSITIPKSDVGPGKGRVPLETIDKLKKAGVEVIIK